MSSVILYLSSLRQGLVINARVRLATSKPQCAYCYQSPQHQGYRCARDWAYLFTWVLGIRTRVLMLVRKPINTLGSLPNPSS